MSKNRNNTGKAEKVSINTQHLAWMDTIKREKNINKRRNLLSVQQHHQRDQIASALNKFDPIFSSIQINSAHYDRKFDSLHLPSQTRKNVRQSIQAINEIMNSNNQSNVTNTNNLNSRESISNEPLQRVLMSRANSVQNQSGKQRLILQQRLKQMNQPKEITMDLAIQGSRNSKHLNFDSGISNQQGEYMDRANTSTEQKRSSNNLRRPLYGASIKVFHDQEDMKWAQSKLYKKFFNSNKHLNQTFDSNLNYDDPTLDPSKQFSHDSMFKRKQLQNQSQVFVDRYNNNYEQSSVMQIKRKIESMSVDNPFTYVEMQNKKLAGESNNKNIEPREFGINDQTNNFRPHPLMMKRGSVILPNTKSIRNQTNINTLTHKNLSSADQNIKVNTLIQNSENLNQEERRLRIREQILKVIQKSPQKAKDMYQYINNYTRTQQKTQLNSQLLNESQ